MKEEIAEITSLTPKGSGLGTLSTGQKAEVPFTLPGETVRALFYKKRRGVFQGRLEEVLKPSHDRIEPRCQHFGRCGGCSFQNISYTKQLKIKQERIEKLFDHPVNPIIGSENPWQYRNKMEFSFSSDKCGNEYLGLILKGTRGYVFDVEECHLVHDWIPETLSKVREWWQKSDLKAYHPHKDTGALRTVTLREGMRTGDRLVMLTVSGRPEYALKAEEISHFVAAVKGEKTSVFMQIHQAIKGAPTQFYEMHLDGPEFYQEEILNLNFQVGPSAFFQPNTQMAEVIYQKAIEIASIGKSDLVYDLYCGTGTMGICAAQKARGVIGVELSTESSLDARENAKLNRVENIKIITGDVGKVLKELEDKPDVVLVDPPRVGLSPQAIENIIALGASKIVYVSCNATTQVEDCKKLQEAGYSIKTIQPVDQFPQTPHCENIVYLEK